MKRWFLTWNNGTSRIVIAPDKEAATIKVGKGVPYTINEIPIKKSSMEEIRDCLIQIEDLIETVRAIMGV